MSQLAIDRFTWLTLVISLRRFFAADASSCSVANRFSLSSNCFFSMATGSPFCVAWKCRRTQKDEFTE